MQDPATISSYNLNATLPNTHHRIRPSRWAMPTARSTLPLPLSVSVDGVVYRAWLNPSDEARYRGTALRWVVGRLYVRLLLNARSSMRR